MRAGSEEVFLNLNVQSLMSKFDKLKSFVLNLTNNGVTIDLIAMQETWCIKNPKLLTLPGFQPLIFTNRCKGRGGGGGILYKRWLKLHTKGQLITV